MDLRDISTETHLDVLKDENPGLKSLLLVYPEDQLDKLVTNKSKLSNVIKFFDKNLKSVHSSNSLVMCCNSTTCPYKDVCILLKNDLAPIGASCPIEKKIAMELECDVIASLNIEPTNTIEMEMLWDLIDSKLLDMRASGALRNMALTQTVVTTAGHSSSTREEINPVVEAKFELKRIKHSIIDTFVATRRAKKKYGMESDSSLLDKLLRQAQGQNEIEQKLDEDKGE